MAKFKLSKEEKKKIKQNRKGFFQEFKEFITRGNVVDMATGVIVASAFTKIITSLTNDIFMPFVNWIVYTLTGGEKILLITPLNGKPYFIDGEIDAVTNVATKVVNPECIYINWGTLLQAIIDFLLIALIIFTVVKVINSVHAKLQYLKGKQHEKVLAEVQVAKEEAEAARAQAEAEKMEAERIAQEEKARADELKAQNESTNQLLVEIINLLKK